MTRYPLLLAAVALLSSAPARASEPSFEAQAAQVQAAAVQANEGRNLSPEIDGLAREAGRLDRRASELADTVRLIASQAREKDPSRQPRGAEIYRAMNDADRLHRDVVTLREQARRLLGSVDEADRDLSNSSDDLVSAVRDLESSTRELRHEANASRQDSGALGGQAYVWANALADASDRAMIASQVLDDVAYQLSEKLR